MARKRSRNEASQGTEIDQFSLFFRARDASRTGWSKMSRLGVHVGSIFDPKMVPKRPQESSRSGRSGLLVVRSLVGQVLSSCSSRPSRRLGRPGATDQS